MATAELGMNHGDGWRLPPPSWEQLAAGVDLDQEATPTFRHLADEQWRYEELPTWHWPMFTRPADLADLLHRAAT